MSYAIERKVLGLKKEVIRGTAETAPATWVAIDRATEFDYRLVHIEDAQIRGFKDRLAPQPGIKECSGKVKFDVEAMNVGEFLMGLLGSVASVQPDAVGNPTVWKHTFTRLNDIVLPSYTYFLDRQLSVKKYNLGTVKKIAFAGTMDGKVTADVDILAKTEAPGGIGTPVFTAPKPLMFFQADIKFGTIGVGVSNVDLRNWTLNIDNQSKGKRVLNGSQDVVDIVASDRLMIDGGYEIYFENETQRNNFLALDNVPVEIILTGATISGVYKYFLDIKLYDARFTAYPFGEMDGLLGAAVTFTGHYSLTDTKSIQIELQNTVTAY